MTIRLPLTKKLEGILVAERAATQEGINRERLLNERLVKKRQDMTLGNETEEPMDHLLGEDMAVTVGDTVINHYHPEPTPAPVVAPQPTVVNRTSSIPSWFYPAVLVVGILAAGSLAWLAFKPQPTVTRAPAVFDITVPE